MAEELSSRRPGATGGIRRGELIRAAGTVLGVFDPQEQAVVNRFQIIRRLTSAGYSTEHGEFIDTFFDWIDQLHHINYAKALDARASAIATGDQDLPVVDSITRRNPTRSIINAERLSRH
ncbi:hypothetical protein ACIQ1J_30670 [Streptomyces sp. NPDC097107]|uniref:hypothetical protein n=1 Tax=Streptomyces sp. NPDC097107 TaxID=3366089 RepID=UPI00380CAEFE